MCFLFLLTAGGGQLYMDALLLNAFPFPPGTRLECSRERASAKRAERRGDRLAAADCMTGEAGF